LKAVRGKDENLTKAHIKYLEGKLIERALITNKALHNYSSKFEKSVSADESKRLTQNEMKWYSPIMSMTAEKLVSEALDLPCPIRAFVAERLIESLDTDTVADLSPEWKEEIEKRCREVDEGIVNLIPATEVFEKAYARLS